jgi:creatinine amidohydrolase/Fe(II)-dependent formamide hydrolase-like protein
VRASTLLAVFMDLATDLGEAGFKHVFVLNMHGAPNHNRVLDDAARYFNETYGGQMVHLTGLVAVAGAMPRDLFSAAERATEGFSVHADADEHSRLLFLRPDTVDPGYRSAPPIVARNPADLVAIATGDAWSGYFGTPAIANASAGSRAMTAIAQAAADTALKMLDGGTDQGLPRVAGQVAGEPTLTGVLDRAAEHERRIAQRQSEWLARQPR